MGKKMALLFSFCLATIAFVSVTTALPFQEFDDQEIDFFRADSATSGPPKCVPSKACANHGDCAGSDGKPGQPRCIGALVGKCDCGACIGGLPCKNDSKCGGLSGACNSKTGTCNCLQAAQDHYDNEGKAMFPTLGAAISHFCNQESCHNSTVGCYGLPCKKGVCVCA